MEVKNSIAAQFKEAIKAKGLTQNWVAAQLEVHYNTISKMLRNEPNYPITEKWQTRLNAILGTTIGEPENPQTD